MARYRAVDVKVWGDEKFRELSRPPPSGQFLWLHLLTGPHTGILPGLARVGEAQLAEQLGWPVAALRRTWREIHLRGMADADWVARVLFIPKRIRYPGASPENPNVVTSWRAEWDEIPVCPLKVHAWRVFREHMVERDDRAALACREKNKAPPRQSFLKAFLAACPNPDGRGEGDGAGRRSLELFAEPSREGSGERSPEGSADGTPNQEQEQEQEQEQDSPPSGREAGGKRPARKARMGVGSPAFEVVDHWTRTVWPAMSPTPCPDVTLAQVTSLSGLVERYSVAGVKAAMDRAAADEFWRDKLDLETLITKFPRFVERHGGAPAAPRQGGPTGAAPPAPASKFRGGERELA